MTSDRLKLALEQIPSSEWALFERLASAFLASEFDSLRTTAAPSGDGGRDSQLFSQEGDVSVVFQYSLAADWKGKIKATVKRIEETTPSTRMLIYLTNRRIGADGDKLKQDVWKSNKIVLDIRDQSWFIDRVYRDTATVNSSEALCKAIVDPLLEKAGVQASVPQELSNPEAIAALTFLGLRWEDDTSGKGLTKLTFEALVRSVLAGTNSDKRLHRTEIKKKVRSLLPEHAHTQVDVYTDNALARLTKQSVRHWIKEDEFCLTHEETIKYSDYKIKIALVRNEIQRVVSNFLSDGILKEPVDSSVVGAIQDVSLKAIDDFLYERSQEFASAVYNECFSGFNMTEVNDFCVKFSAQLKPTFPKVDIVRILHGVISHVLTSSEESVAKYLRNLADAYTLQAFLKLTPDVQRAVQKMFAHGNIWLDATITLPLLAETVNGQERGRFHRMIDAAREAGLKLFVTNGIVEEMERHMNMALYCARVSHSEWRGQVPLLLDKYLSNGNSPDSFSRWLETFRGEARPADDIADHLKDQYGIEVVDLEEAAASTPAELRDSVQRILYDMHRKRRNHNEIEELTLNRLVAHDVECYCGIIGSRAKEKHSTFGYSSWWLTLDHKIYSVITVLKSELSFDPPSSPVLSADFLINYLAFGPARVRINKSTESKLPLLMNTEAVSYFTTDLVAEARKLHGELKGLPESVVRRRVRDQLDKAKRQLGPVSDAGMTGKLEADVAT